MPTRSHGIAPASARPRMGITWSTGQRQRRRFGSTFCAADDNQSGRINHRAPSHPGCSTREGVTPWTTTVSVRPCRPTSSSALMMQSPRRDDFKLKRMTFANAAAHYAIIWPPPAAIVRRLGISEERANRRLRIGNSSPLLKTSSASRYTRLARKHWNHPRHRRRYQPNHRDRLQPVDGNQRYVAVRNLMKSLKFASMSRGSS